MTLFLVKPRSHRRQEQGYVLITLLLTVSLMTIAALAILPSITFAIKRDQEQEMIHRGVQYSRAIRTYYKKFGRYPTRLEDLDNTNNLRYLRKHYKDSLTGKDFKLLHFGEPGLSLGGSFGGGVIPGANPIGSPAGANGAGGSAFGGSNFGGSSFGGSSGSSFGGSSGSTFGGNSASGNSGGFGNSGVNNSGVFSQSSSFGGNSNGGNANSSFGANSSSQSSSPQQGTSSASGPDATQASTQVAAGGAANAEAPGSAEQQVIAGGPIVGVASISKKTTIREFNHKKKYNEWQFIYDPTADRGGLITTPYQPALQGFGTPQNVNAQSPGSNGTSTGSSFGNSFGNSFGQPPGIGNNSNSIGGQTPPAQPPSTAPQQQ
jgi:type II secretory pathway pseudopilin PulG